MQLVKADSQRGLLQFFTLQKRFTKISELRNVLLCFIHSILRPSTNDHSDLQYLSRRTTFVGKEEYLVRQGACRQTRETIECSKRFTFMAGCCVRADFWSFLDIEFSKAYTSLQSRACVNSSSVLTQLAAKNLI